MDQTFSKKLKKWQKSHEPKNLATLTEAFGEKTFAVLMFIFMLFPALPIPTAAHLFEAIVIIVAAEQVWGRKSIWLPNFLASRIKMGRPVKSKHMDNFIRRIEWLEIRFRPKGQGIFTAPLVGRMIGMFVILFTATAFVSPPFSGLDTLPSMGVVILSLGILLDNVYLLMIGILVGSMGVGLAVFFASAITELFKHIAHR